MAEEEGDDYGRGYYRPPTLGELSRSLAQERGELQNFDLKGKPGVPPQSPGGPAAVADLNRATGLIETTETRPISPRPPALLYQVVSTYDSRPIQAYDFQASGCDVLEFFDDGGAGEFDPIFFDYIVPSNVVAVLRGFRYQVSLAPTNMVTEGGCWLQSDLFVNDLPVREYNKMFHPVFMRKFFDTFVIVDELNTIRLQLSHTADNELFSATAGVVSPVLFEFYGNLLLKTGVPIDFEIANAIGGGQL